MNRISRFFLGVLCLFCIFPSLLFAQEGYYLLGNESLEFRLAVDGSKALKNPSDWEKMSDIKNNKLFVFKKAEINSADVDGLLIEKSRWEDEYEITIYFKKKSWDKVRKITEQLINKRLGIIRGGRLINAPVVLDALKDSAVITPMNQSQIKWFVNGLILKEPMTEELKVARRKEHLKNLEEIVNKQPDDLNLKLGLAREYAYARGEVKDCKKAIALFKEVFEKDKTRTDIYSDIASCYSYLKEYDKAIKYFQNAINTKSENEWIFRLQLAEIYKELNQNDNALKEIERSIEFLKASDLPNKEKNRNIEMIEDFKKSINFEK
jgi:tetratricopeptide (TPR) repeat protein